MKRALISVSDKTKLPQLGKFLHSKKVEIISTGGTGKILKENGIPYTDITEVTGNPEAFRGRMKTISFEISSSLLFKRDDQGDIDQAKELGIEPIDLVVCNLYPFEEVAKTSKDLDQLIENIDIGGPTMIRAAAKNYKHVTTLTSPDQYPDFMDHFENLNQTSRLHYAMEALNLTAHYDQFIHNHLQRFHLNRPDFALASSSRKELRYGENPHQNAWLQQLENTDQKITLANSQPLQGKQLSYNNLLDADSAWKVTSDLHLKFSHQKIVSIIKHLNPCGVAIGKDSLTTLTKAWSCDPVSSFGSVISFNFEVNENCAQWLSDKFVEILIAPGFSSGARELLAKKKNLRLLQLPNKHQDSNEMTIRSINGGLLLQEEDELVNYEFNPVTKNLIDPNMSSLKSFGMIVNKYLKSNAITLVGQKDDYLMLAGAGMGQPNRLDSLKMLAAPRAMANGFEMQDLILISDAFFPFKDSIEVCAEVGIKNIIQPGGSIRDAEVIDCCEVHQIAMELSGIRHFRH